MTISGRPREVPEVWQWQYLRAEEIARERIAEASDWRRARNAGRARSALQAPQDAERRWNVVARGLRRALPTAE